MRRFLLALFVVSVLALTFAPIAKADVILFPYINENPGKVSTLITVINGTACIGGSGSTCSGGSAVTDLHYRYMTKQIKDSSQQTQVADEIADAVVECQDTNFCRPTSLNDIVTFDASGHLNGGQALFGDPGAGAGNLYNKYGDGSFKDTLTPQPRRGYLLVSHAASGCQDITTFTNAPLSGEAMLIDVVNGEAWGYSAVVESTTNFNFSNSELTLRENGYSFYENTAIFPPSLFTTRYFITPTRYGAGNFLGSTYIDYNMADKSFQKKTRFGLSGWSNREWGIYNRNEVWQSSGVPRDVICVAAFSLQTLIDTNGMAFINNSGGWAVANLKNPLPQLNGEFCIPNGDYEAFVYQLTFGSAANLIPGVLGLTNDGKQIWSNDDYDRIYPDPISTLYADCP